MFRIAVIQNEVEMQHSGYVDAVPKYRKLFNFDVECIFNRFSSININELFREGTNYLLDYDCLILGTNATSDEDVYSFLTMKSSQKLLEKFISRSKGLLVCSQKKLDVISIVNNERQTYFLPEKYEYRVHTRPSSENSSDGSIHIATTTVNPAQEFILSYPNKITDNLIESRCIENDFQRHFYRDYIIPNNESSFFSLLLDNRDSINRNTLMVASQHRNEHIIVSTMALDWAGHFELLENIIYYLMLHVPKVAFLKKNNHKDAEFEFLISEASLAKTPHFIYSSIDNLNSSEIKKQHTLYVLSPSFSESDVVSFWEKDIKPMNKNIKLFYYKRVGSENELALVKFSLFSYIDKQKRDVKAWLVSKYNNELWDNSFWKTYDVLLALEKSGFNLDPYLAGIFNAIDSHYKIGSYDGVLAPTCGLLELQSIALRKRECVCEVAGIEENILTTENWLIDKYIETSSYNKKFIIRSFNRAGRLTNLKNFLETKQLEFNFLNDFKKVAASDDSIPTNEKLEIDLCLGIEVCILYNKSASQPDSALIRKIRDYCGAIVDAQGENGLWDNNLVKTARIIVFLIENKRDIAGNLDSTSKNKFEKAIDSGIMVLRGTYQENNWENNIISTANSLNALVSFDIETEFKSKDFLDQVNNESALLNSYESLDLSLTTIDNLVQENTERLLKLQQVETELNNKNNELLRLKIKNSKANNCLRILSSISGFSVLLVISYYVFLALKDWALFVTMITESLMWIPIVIGIGVTALVAIIPDIIKKRQNR